MWTSTVDSRRVLSGCELAEFDLRRVLSGCGLAEFDLRRVLSGCGLAEFEKGFKWVWTRPTCAGPLSSSCDDPERMTGLQSPVVG